MPLPSTKDELLKNLNHAYEKLDDEFEVVDEGKGRADGIEGNIFCCDVIAYQIGWARLLMGWEKQEMEGQNPEMPAPGFKWNQLSELAQAFYRKESNKSLHQLRNEFKGVHLELSSWINSLTEQELYLLHQRKWTGDKWPMIKWIQVNTIAPYRSARTKVRRWKKENEI